MSSLFYPEVSYFVSKTCDRDWELSPREIEFYSMVFVEEGSADYIIAGQHKRIETGDVLCMPPGTFRTATTTGMTCIGINFFLPQGCDFELPLVTHWGDLEDFHIHFRDLKFEWLQQRVGFELKSAARLMLILHKLLYQKKHDAKNVHVEAMKSFIMENHKQDLSMAIIAKEVGLSSVYCGALFKKIENCTIAEFLTRVRINRAMTLLETGEHSISETAEECGFVDIYYFSNTFKKIVGISPSKYKNKRSMQVL